MATSWMHAAARFDFELRLACPDVLQPPAEVVAWAREEGANVTVSPDVEAAVRGADAIVTDTWVSMGDDVGDSERRLRLLGPYQVNEDVMAMAAPHAIFMHCLPAHRGKEVAPDVMDGTQSVVWDEAENRLHAQKGILVYCMT
jgi:ornithine carbamoyltransferase